jgi:hypothetical protein
MKSELKWLAEAVEPSNADIMDATAREFAPSNEVRYATPGTPENKAYHAKLDEIHRMALEIMRAKREGR